MALIIANMFGLLRKNYRNDIRNSEIRVKTTKKLQNQLVREFTCTNFGADDDSVERQRS